MSGFGFLSDISTSRQHKPVACQSSAQAECGGRVSWPPVSVFMCDLTLHYFSNDNTTQSLLTFLTVDEIHGSCFFYFGLTEFSWHSVSCHLKIMLHLACCFPSSPGRRLDCWERWPFKDNRQEVEETNRGLEKGGVSICFFESYSLLSIASVCWKVVYSCVHVCFDMLLGFGFLRLLYVKCPFVSVVGRVLLYISPLVWVTVRSVHLCWSFSSLFV